MGTDGHVWLGWDDGHSNSTTTSTSNPNRIDYRKSCTRYGLGSHNQFLTRHKTLQQVAGTLRLELASVQMMRSNCSKTLLSDNPLDHRLNRLMQQVEAVLNQDISSGSPVPVEEQVLLLLAASSQEFDFGPKEEEDSTWNPWTSFAHYLRENYSESLLEKVRVEGRTTALGVGLAKELHMAIKVFSALRGHHSVSSTQTLRL